MTSIKEKINISIGSIVSMVILTIFALVLIAQLTVCRSSPAYEENDTPEYIFVPDFVLIRGFAVDDKNFYIALNEKIDVFNYSGNRLFTVNADGMINSLIQLSNGRIAANYRGSGGGILQYIDTDGRALGKILESSQQLTYTYPGNDDFLYLTSDQTNLFGLYADTGESVKILSWLDSSIIADDLITVAVMGDNQVLAISRGWDNFNDRPTIELIVLNKTITQDSEISTITFSTFFLDWQTRNAIADFNQSNKRYHVQVTDYSEYATDDDYNSGVMKLSTEIIAGNIPDILDVSALPKEQYALVGLLEDLYPYIDNDHELQREDLLENVLRVSEIEDSLYYIFPFFNITTVIGNPDVLGSAPYWNMEEFRTVLEENPDADIPLGAGVTNEYFLSSAVLHNMDFFVNPDAGTVNFDNEVFIKLLEIASLFPSGAPDFGTYDERDDIASGRQIMQGYYFDGFNQYQMYREFFGGEIVFKGFPSDSGSGNSISGFPTLAITSVSENKDGAWSFIRSLMTVRWQHRVITQSPNYIPLNRAVFDWMIERAMNQEEHTVSIGTTFGGSINSVEVTISPLSQAEMDRFMEMLNSALQIRGPDDTFIPIMNIIIETASDYFSGHTTPEDAAGIIQSRVSILISEQFG